MEDVHAEDAMRQTREEQKIQNVERQKAYQGRKSNEMTSEEREERKKKRQIDKKNIEKESWMN